MSSNVKCERKPQLVQVITWSLCCSASTRKESHCNEKRCHEVYLSMIKYELAHACDAARPSAHCPFWPFNIRFRVPRAASHQGAWRQKLRFMPWYQYVQLPCYFCVYWNHKSSNLQFFCLWLRGLTIQAYWLTACQSSGFHIFLPELENRVQNCELRHGSVPHLAILYSR